MFGWLWGSKKKATIAATIAIPAPLRIQRPAPPAPPAPPLGRAIPAAPRATQQEGGGDDGFGISMAIGYVMNDGIIGGLIGGNLAAGMLGGALNSSDSEPDTSSCDSGSSSYDGGPSDGDF